MDNDSVTSRAERTFWTVWNYITGAVNRFFRPGPTDIVTNEPNSFQESAVDSEPTNCGHAESSTSRREVSEEQPLTTVSVLSSPRPGVAWELCTADIDLRPDEESNESKASDEREGTREEQFVQTGNNDAGLLVTEDAKEDKQEGNEVQKLYSHGGDQPQENDEYEEHVNTRSVRLRGDAMSEDMEESARKDGAETERVATLDDQQKMHETMTKIQVKEKEEMHHDNDQELKEEGIEARLCTVTDLSPGEEDNMHIKEVRVQKDEAGAAVICEEAEDSDGVSLLASENEKKSDEGARQVDNPPSDDDRDFKGDPSFTSLHVELQIAYDKSGIVSEEELIVVGQEHVMMAHACESDKVEDAKEREDESTLDEREQGAVIKEENANEAGNSQTKDEVPDQKDHIKSEDVQEEDTSTGHVACSEEDVQDAKRELHKVEFTHGEQEDVAQDTEVQREADDVEPKSHSEEISGKSDMTTTDICIDETFFNKYQFEEERLPSEVGGIESYVGVICATTSGETGQEISGEFKNIPMGVCEGRLVSEELNSPTCEETQEGVPGYNNEPGPDENTTQRFLEVGDCEEIQTTQLPEEVESKEPESVQNSGCSVGAGYLLVTEHMEEDQESTGDIRNSFDLVVEEHAGGLRLTDAGLPQETDTPLVQSAIQESGLLFEEEEGKLLTASMKTGIEHPGKEFEMHTGLTGVTDRTTHALQAGAEELLIESAIDEGLCDFKEADAAGDERETTGAVAEQEDETLKFLEAEVQKMTEMSFFQESIEAIDLEQKSCKTPSLPEDLTESGFLKQSLKTEPKLLEDSATEMQDEGMDMEETGYGAEEDEARSENEMEILDLQVAGMTAELITERNEKENALITESESLETQLQLSHKAPQISNKETETADKSITSESKTKDLNVISAEEMAKHMTESERSRDNEETVSPISGCQDVIEEEILDLWLQTTLSEDNNDIEQQEVPEPGQQMQTETEPSREERGEISSEQVEKVEEQLVESKSAESELVSDAEMSLESGFLDLSLDEWGTQNSGTQLLTSISAESFQGIYDMLANMSQPADISGPSTQPNSECENVLMEEMAETEQSHLKEEESATETGFHPDSGATSSEAAHLNQESDNSQENIDEETGSQKETDAEEANVESLTETGAPFKVGETKVGDEPLEITVSDSPDEIEHTGSGRPRSRSEAPLEEGIMSTESGSQGHICTESEKKLLVLPSLDKAPRWPENIIDSLPELNRAEMAEPPRTESAHQMEVDVSVLDFTVQKARIAVKNPCVRPPKDPRSLLNMPSVDPTPSSHVPVKVHPGVPLGGMGIGIKLPGLGAGFPVLKRTQREEPETKPEEESNTPKEDEPQRKPKWMPPGHPGFGNPLLSELKTKLKKTTKE
ncbi:uncharacterized protein LOC143338651 isoform X1 [Chaetodon auriga]|uniref:uncharacterized protein LOC143338651 isoform X1 n=1 Tax=Chaetodon auriga TaxID=39042 RepID=UPI004032C9CF